MSSRREIQVSEALAHLAGEYFAREANTPNTGGSLMTVTRASVSPDFKNVTIYFSVLPESQEKPALDFAKRARSDFREYVKKHSFLHPIPTIDFELDYGEKNRQRVDDLTRK